MISSLVVIEALCILGCCTWLVRNHRYDEGLLGSIGLGILALLCLIEAMQVIEGDVPGIQYAIERLGVLLFLFEHITKFQRSHSGDRNEKAGAS